MTRIVITSDLDRARDIAVALEQQVAAALEIHRPAPSSRLSLQPYCRECIRNWPCPTASALGVDLLDEDETDGHL